MNIKPLRDNVIVELKQRKQSEIIEVVSSEKTETEGVVVAVGLGTLLENGNTRPIPVKVGDHILFDRMRILAVKIAGKTYARVPEPAIVGVWEE